MNLYSGGPSKVAITRNRNKNSSHPTAITGRQASVLIRSANNPLKKFLFMNYFNIGILIP